MKKCVECNEKIARYWKNIDRSHFCEDCFREILTFRKEEKAC